VLERHADRIGPDLPAYRNHIYRIVNLMDAMAPVAPDEYPAVGTAAAFHDIGLWTTET
jgi:cobalamin biosynthesis protein CobD/CbiB